MLEHMVWLKFHPSVGQQRIDQHLDALRSLKKIVPGIIELSVGPSFTDRAGGYRHGLLVRLGSRADLETYLQHPEHLRVATTLKADAAILALDIEA